jgi:hypothetical protein
MKTLARRQDRAQVLRRLRTLRQEHPARWGRMSTHEMVCHLADSARVALGERTASSATGPLQRTLVKWGALYLPLRWPKGIPTRPEVDQLQGGTRPTEFAVDVADLERLIERMSSQPGNFAWAPHPVFGPMSRGAWLRWGYLHADHHLRQFGA